MGARFASRKEFANGPLRTMPFRFRRLDEHRFVIVNFAGEHLTVSEAELARLVRSPEDLEEEALERLLGRQFLADSLTKIEERLLANKLRTRLSDVRELTSLHMFVVSLRCEHTCAYCQVSRQVTGGSGYDMDKATAERAVEVALSSPTSHIKIEFQQPLVRRVDVVGQT